MNPLKLYIDEDVMDSRLVAALRSRGVGILTVLDAGLVEKTDEEHLAFASERGCVLYSFNVSDFYKIHADWIASGREHGGLILARQKRFSVGEQVHGIVAASCGRECCGDAESGRILERLGVTK